MSTAEIVFPVTVTFLPEHRELRGPDDLELCWVGAAAQPDARLGRSVTTPARDALEACQALACALYAQAHDQDVETVDAAQAYAWYQAKGFRVRWAV